jgi:tetratricopeptide (TPR) repeat protein
VAPLAYYQFQPGGDGNNSRAGVDLPAAQQKVDKNGEKNLLTEEAIKEIETLVKSREIDKAQALLTPALKQAYFSNDKLAQVKLLYLQGRIFGEKANFQEAITTLNQAIAIAKPLNDPNLLLGPVINLANIYHVTDQNVAAAEQAQKCLALALQAKNLSYQVASLQSLAINGFLAHQAILSEQLLEQSISLAQQQNDFYTMAHGYAYLGIIKTELHKFDLATEQFNKALGLVSLLDTLPKRAYLEFVINGYYARSQALAGNTKAAIKLYQVAITKAQIAGVRQYLALSQLNYGLAQCLRAQNQTIEAEKTLVKAELFEEEAYKRCEAANLAMSFALVRQMVRRCK